LQLYALHEIEAAVVKYKKGESATKALDEWWVFYVGSLEDGKMTSGFGPYILPEKRDAFFGKNLISPENTKSSLNAAVYRCTKK